jgi:hypothetical protein
VDKYEAERQEFVQKLETAKVLMCFVIGCDVKERLERAANVQVSLKKNLETKVVSPISLCCQYQGYCNARAAERK